MQGSLLNTVYNALEACRDAAGGFEQSVEQYSETAIADNGLVQDSVYNLTEYYYDLAEGVGSVETALGGLAGAYRNAASAAAALAAAQAGVTGSVGNVGDLDDPDNILDNSQKTKEKAVSSSISYDSSMGDSWVSSNPTQINNKDYYYWGEDENGDGLYVEASNIAEYWGGYKYIIPGTNPRFYYLERGGHRYATGGLADYTGPAWLDGTPSKPEAVLNPLQTKHFIQFTNILDSLFSNASLPNTTSQPSQKSGDTQYNFTITVDQMANDYDVDKLIARIEDKMLKASQYRNINIIKKSK
jgi:hypothetical protein